jgi:hypothetical protein
MAGEHGLDGVARREGQDHEAGGLNANVMVLLGLARAGGDGFGDTATDVGQEVSEGEFGFGVHGCLGDRDVSLSLYI